MFTLKNLFSCIMLSTISISAFAIETKTVECEKCETDYQFLTAAKREAVLNVSTIVNVLNYKNYELRKFDILKRNHIECEYDNEPDGRGGKTKICREKSTYKVSNPPISNDELTSFINYAETYNNAQKFFLQHAIEVPSDVVSSGYELIGNTSKQWDVTRQLTESSYSQNFSEKFLSLIVGKASLFKNGYLNLGMPPIVFSFSDGIKAYAVIDFIDMDGVEHFKFLKLVDAENNVIDLSSNNPFQGRLFVIGESMTVQSWSTLLTALNAYGLMVPGASSRIVPRGTVKIVPICSSSNPCPQPE
ncbi:MULTISPECIES: hypothetical protein [Shewanella]|uniref:hypothetical protein n=1 Tax=Shewanella TaxID=22 RepID=UPI001AACA5F0|nr:MULTISPECIES: hypothetical protein [Shewanella]EKT4488959.1 hypothetical protein [Shewanella algae]MBO2611001.1 hypothetical protein [Shewanella algae]MBO2661449.1 hypothetical protein [Shewanella algae]MCL1054468.1 hypothetical protein [Shewanella algae]